jgi:hypothetical protein
VNLRKSTPRIVRVYGRRASRTVGAATAGMRMRPSAIVVGAQRCGTTSLYRALMTHPAVLPPVMHKGINYFDVNYDRGPDWYYGHFPIQRRARRAGGTSVAPIAFEASGYYMFHPLAPERLARDLPEVKLIALVRDPVERAYSAHKHEKARGFESETFERALGLEEERLDGEVERMRRDPMYHSFSHRHHAYRGRGRYAEQITTLVNLFGDDQVLVMESEAFFEHPEREYERVLDFLGLPSVMPERFDKYNGRPRAPMDASTRQQLRWYFKGPDAALAEILGRAPTWQA